MTKVQQLIEKDEKRYNDLCKLNYYRKNYQILNLKQTHYHFVKEWLNQKK